MTLSSVHEQPNHPFRLGTKVPRARHHGVGHGVELQCGRVRVAKELIVLQETSEPKHPESSSTLLEEFAPRNEGGMSRFHLSLVQIVKFIRHRPETLDSAVKAKCFPEKSSFMSHHLC